jgi:hypothetical protein
MSDSSKKDSPTLFFRVYTKPDGKAYLLYEPGNQEVEINPPVNKENLEEAKSRLIVQSSSALEDERKAERERLEGCDEATVTPQQLAHRQIRKSLEPEKLHFFESIKHSFVSVQQGLFALLAIWLLISLFYKGVDLSEHYLPEAAHLFVLVLYVIGLGLCIYLMATDEKRRQETKRIRDWFGPRGMLVLPCLTLVTAAAVFGSITLSLHRHGLVSFQECAGRPVAAGSLTDFYMWHFMKLVPLVKINEVLKLNEPLCYSQKRVGLLILLFQALVVIPSINTVLYYWKNRHVLTAPLVDYVYEPGWEPGEEKAEAS